MSLPESYAHAWADLRRRRSLYKWLFMGFVPANFFVLMLVPGFFPATGVVWFLALMVAAIRSATFHCPRCGNRFAGRWVRDPFTSAACTAGC